MSLISLIIILVLIGVIMWAVNQYAPMAQPFKNILNIVVVLVVVLWLLQVFGVLSGVGDIRIR